MVKKKQEDEKRKELEETLKRVQADFINFRNRVEAEKKDFLTYASKDLILQLIPILDNFERAFSHIPNDLKDNEWVSGVKYIENQLKETLEKEGLKRIETIGREFDYTYHEAVGFEESKEGKDGEITREHEAGYTLNGKIIKPAKVIVNTQKHKK